MRGRRATALAYLASSMASAAAISHFVAPSSSYLGQSAGPPGALIYAASMVAASAALAYVIVRRYSSLVERLVNAYVAAAAFLSALALEGLAGLSLPLPLGIALAAAPVLPAALSRLWPPMMSAFYTIAAVLAAAVLAAALPFGWAPILLAAFAAYDAFAVLRGPLSSLPQGFRLMLVDVGSVRIGMGDVAFYSFVVSSLEIYRGPAYSALGGALVIAGAAATLELLARVKRPLPGLTIPLALSLLAFLVRI